MPALLGLGAFFIVSAIACYLIALGRGLNPVFWVVMGIMFGPLAVGAALLVEPKTNADRPDE